MARKSNPKLALILFSIIALVCGIGLIALPVILSTPTDVAGFNEITAKTTQAGWGLLGVSIAMFIMGLFKKKSTG